MKRPRIRSVAPALLAWTLSTAVAAAGPAGQETVNELDRQEPVSSADAGRGEIVVSMRDIAALGRPGRGDLVVEADGTASTIDGGESLRLSLPPEELDRLRRELVKDLNGLEPGIRTTDVTDQPLTTVAVVASDGGSPVEVSVYGGAGPPGFRNAVDRLTELVESIRARGKVDERAPILVTVVRDPAREAERTIDWPEAVPEPMLGPTRVAYVPVVGESARELRQRLGSPNTDVGVRLADGSVAIATWTAVLPAPGG